MTKESKLYATISLLAGVLIGIFVTSNVVNNNMTGMMQMMGIRRNFGDVQTGRGLQTISIIDRHFIEQMIPHHEGAIEMAQLAKERASRAEIKTLAGNIIKSQSEEIKNMRSWYESWYRQDVPTIPGTGMGMGRGMMHGGMMGDKVDIEALKQAENFDKAFIEEMIPHHQMAVMMANMLLQGTNRDEMKTLARNIIDAQTKEMEMMRQWYKELGIRSIR